MSQPIDTTALAHDIEHWISKLANTRTGSAHHRVAQRELVMLIMRERALILSCLRLPAKPLLAQEEDNG